MSDPITGLPTVDEVAGALIASNYAPASGARSHWLGMSEAVLALFGDAVPRIMATALREAAVDAVDQCFCCPASDDYSPASYWLRARAEMIEAEA